MFQVINRHTSLLHVYNIDFKNLITMYQYILSGHVYEALASKAEGCGFQVLRLTSVDS